MTERNTGFFLVRTLFLACLTAVLLIGCSRIRLEKKLGPDDADFFNKVRYIMTKDESKIFLELPREERQRFKREFWKRRDPDPETEDNEVERDYYNRLEEAGRLFRTEGKEGWLTDRGRIYILFGPPMDRIQFPQGGDPYNRCREIWYYGNFPVVFVDSSCTGIYELVTYDLTGLRSSNLIYMHLLNLAQIDAQKESGGTGPRLFDFSWKVKKKTVEAGRVTAEIQVDVPYKMIWFGDKDGRLQATLYVELGLIETKGQVVWNFSRSYSLEMTDDLVPKKKKFRILIPLELTSGLDKLRSGRNTLHITLTNRADGSMRKKSMDFKIRSSD